MRGSLSGGYVRKTGDTMSGGLTISANAGNLLTLDRPDGAAHNPLRFKLAGADWGFVRHALAQPRLLISDSVEATLLSLRTDTGLLGTALIPLSMLTRGEASGVHATAFTTVIGAVITLASLDVVTGDRVSIDWENDQAPAAATTDIQTFLRQISGTATGVWIAAGGPASTLNLLVGAGETPGTLEQADAGTNTILVTGTGTMVLDMRGIANGANCTAGVGRMRATVLRG